MALEVQLAERMRVGDAGDSLGADSPFSVLAQAWLEDLHLDMDRSDGIVMAFAVRREIIPRNLVRETSR